MMNYLRANGLKLTLLLVVLTSLSPSALPQPFYEPYGQAQSALAFGRVDQALSHLALARQFEPASRGLIETEFLLALELGDWATAEQRLALLDASELESEEISCGKLQLGLIRDEPLSAIANTTTALSACPNVELALHSLAHAQFESGEFAEVLPLLDNLIDFATQNSEEIGMLALYTAAHDPLNAVVLLRQTQASSSSRSPLALELLLAIQDHDTDDGVAQLYGQIGQIMLRNAQPYLARDALMNAVEEDPQFSRALGFLGMVKDQLGLDGGPQLEQAAELTPEDPLLMVMLATHYNQAEQPTLALPLLEEAATLDPTNPAIAAEFGKTYTQLGDLDAAVQAYRQATLIAPDKPEFWLLLADFSLSYEIEIERLAIPAIRNALVKEPDSLHAWRSLGYAYHLLGNFPLAKRALDQALQRAPNDTQSNYYLGLLFQTHGYTEQAIDAWRQASLSSPDHPYAILAERALDNLGVP